MKRKRYSRKLQRRAVGRTETCEDVGELARELGVRPRCLYKWRKKLEARLNQDKKRRGPARICSLYSISDSWEIRYKIGPLRRKTKIGFKFCVLSKCDPATALIADNYQKKCLSSRFHAKRRRASPCNAG